LEEDTVMNLHFLSNAAPSARGFDRLHHGESRSVGIARMVDWIADGVALARLQPVWWICAILVCADFATLLVLAPPLRTLAPLVAPLAAGVLVLLQERASNARPWTLAEGMAAVSERRNALTAVGFGAVALVALGHAVQFAMFHMSLTPVRTADGAHGLSIVFGTHPAEQTLVESLVVIPFYVLAVAAFWFAPALVMLRKLSPLDAMTASLCAVLRNWPTALLYAAAIAVDVLAAPFLPALVSGLVITPLVSALVILSMYGSYRDVFGQH
jgi:uncharacterized membrane protein